MASKDGMKNGFGVDGDDEEEIVLSDIDTEYRRASSNVSWEDLEASENSPVQANSFGSALLDVDDMISYERTMKEYQKLFNEMDSGFKITNTTLVSHLKNYGLFHLRKRDLDQAYVDAVSEITGLDKDDCKSVIDAFVGIFVEELWYNRKGYIPKVGTIKLTEKTYKPSYEHRVYAERYRTDKNDNHRILGELVFYPDVEVLFKYKGHQKFGNVGGVLSPENWSRWLRHAKTIVGGYGTNYNLEVRRNSLKPFLFDGLKPSQTITQIYVPSANLDKNQFLTVEGLVDIFSSDLETPGFKPSNLKFSSDVLLNSNSPERVNYDNTAVYAKSLQDAINSSSEYADHLKKVSDLTAKQLAEIRKDRVENKGENTSEPVEVDWSAHTARALPRFPFTDEEAEIMISRINNIELTNAQREKFIVETLGIRKSVYSSSFEDRRKTSIKDVTNRADYTIETGDAGVSTEDFDGDSSKKSVASVGVEGRGIPRVPLEDAIKNPGAYVYKDYEKIVEEQNWLKNFVESEFDDDDDDDFI